MITTNTKKRSLDLSNLSNKQIENLLYAVGKRIRLQRAINKIKKNLNAFDIERIKEQLIIAEL
jgi:hypothetical protein